MYNKLAALMRMRKVTAYRVAKETGITQTAISHWKHGRSEPSLKTLKILAHYFEVPLSFFTED